MSRARWLVFTRNKWSAPSDTLSTNQWTSRKTQARTVRGGEGVAGLTITTHWGGVGWPWKRSNVLTNVRAGWWYWSIRDLRGLYGRRWLGFLTWFTDGRSVNQDSFFMHWSKVSLSLHVDWCVWFFLWKQQQQHYMELVVRISAICASNLPVFPYHTQQLYCWITEQWKKAK